MSSQLLYLSNADVQALEISPREAREAIIKGFRDNAAGRNIGLPKSSIRSDSGGWFISMSSASKSSQLATMKAVAVVPVEDPNGPSGINGLVCVSDFKTGVPVAVLDANSITLLRTAAMSAAAAAYLAPGAPHTIGLVGCGLQALSHLHAFADLFPSIRRVNLLSRTARSAERLAVMAAEKKLVPAILDGPDELLSGSQIVISTVPSSPQLKAFLDARLMPLSSFASAVDGGRSWRPETLSAFDRIITDSLAQFSSPIDDSDRPVESIKYQDDLAHLVSDVPSHANPIRALFGFRGFVVADLALAELAIRKARELSVGTWLPR
ncbi:hypothetical protein [Bradyrhizobium sp. DOA9]|uniref:hypothetical protein n=1 Tax=Bradyrhizobium sp. DOA9 TaxID=1126627 RepID=UPI00046B0106|nr:hypothetical protein [Bradyrhizobium sp. DOA9]GAJ37660.1 hypothetical protein BDOA9_0202780 [Bradyrhizobium sp. DOA9]